MSQRHKIRYPPREEVDSDTPNSVNRNSALICLFLFVTSLAVYAQVFTFDFVDYDDDGYVTSNVNVQKGLSVESVVWAITTSDVMAEWLPVNILSHMLDCQIFGLDPRGHHATSILLHALNGVLLFVVFRSVTGRIWPSAFVAAAFALHPLRVESVAWISERKDVLSTFFALLAIWCYSGYAKKGGWPYYLLTLVFFAFGLMSKTMLVTLPFVFLLLDYWPLNRIRFSRNVLQTEGGKVRRDTSFGDSDSDAVLHDRKNQDQIDMPTTHSPHLATLLLEKMPLFLLSAAMSVVTIVTQSNYGSLDLSQSITFVQRLVNAAVVYASYLGMMIWPAKLRVLYPHPNLPGGIPWETWQVTGSVALLVVISVVCVALISKRYLIVGWLWYLGTLVPVIGIMHIGYQSMADRYTYLPTIGILIMIAWSGFDLVERLRGRIVVTRLLAVAVGGWLVAISICTWNQTRHWCDSHALYRRAVQFLPSSPVMHNNLGMIFAKSGEHLAAIEKYTDAVALDPNYAQAFTNRGNAHGVLGNFHQGVQDHSRAIELAPEIMVAHFNRGNLYGHFGHYDLAIRDLTRAIALIPDEANIEKAKIYEIRGLTYGHLGKNKMAVKDFTKAIELNPDSRKAFFRRDQIYQQMRRGTEEQ